MLVAYRAVPLLGFQGPGMEGKGNGGCSCRNESSPQFLIPIEGDNKKESEPWHHVTGAELVPIPKPAEETSLY